MMNSPTPTTGDNCRKLAVPIRFKGPIFPPVASSASPHKGRRTGVAETDPAWNALTEGRITSEEDCIDLISYDGLSRLRMPVTAGFNHSDQQSTLLLADGYKAVVLSRLIEIAGLITMCWEWYGKSAAGCCVLDGATRHWASNDIAMNAPAKRENASEVWEKATP